MVRSTWLAPLGAIFFGLLLLIAAEGFLRLVWSPLPMPAEELAAVAINPFEVVDGSARTRTAYLGAMRYSTFSVPKPHGTYRIFCIGGSTTLGYPYTSEFAWPAGLERRLKYLLPSRKLEVINVGAASYGSARSLAVLRGILEFQPDLVIVATGDAEFVEDSFREVVTQPGPVISWIHGLYLSRGIKQILPAKESSRRLIDAEDRSAAGFLFAPVLAGTVYRVDAVRRDIVMKTLEGNLAEMSMVAKKADVPLMLMTLPANAASWPPDPDKSLPVEPELRSRWQQRVSAAERLVASGRVAEALAEYAAAASLWNGNASVCYDYGQLLVQVKKFDEARTMLLRALDLDPTPVRAMTQVNQSIRAVAARTNVLLADPAEALAALSPHGLIGELLVLDYAHPTPRGHVEIAGVVLRGLLAKELEWNIDESKELAAQQIERDRLAKVMPIINAELSFSLGQVFERKGLTQQAEDMYQQSISQGYNGPFPTYNLARLWASQGHYAKALELMTPLVQRYPGWDEPYALLGYLHQQVGDARSAADWYRRALVSGNPDPRLFVSLAEMEKLLGEFVQARRTLEEGLLVHSDNCDLAISLGRMLEQEGGPEITAEDFYRRRLSIDPTCQLLWENLGLLLMQQQRWSEAEKVFTMALQQPAPLAQHHLNLGYVYWKGMDDRVAAGKHFASFIKAHPEGVHLVPVDFRKETTSRVQP